MPPCLGPSRGGVHIYVILCGDWKLHTLGIVGVYMHRHVQLIRHVAD